MEKNEWLIPLLRKVFGYESKTATRIKSMEKVYQQIVAQSERDEFYDGKTCSFILIIKASKLNEHSTTGFRLHYCTCG